MKQLARTLRRRAGVAMAEVDRLTGQVAAIARHTLSSVRVVARNARRTLARRPGDGRLGRLVGELQETVTATERLLAQTDQRLAGDRVIPDRLVSLSDPDARPIRKGKPRHPTQFGYTLLLAEEERGFICDHRLQLAHLAERVRSGRLHPIIGAVRPLAEATAAFTPDRRIPGKTIIRVTEGE